MAATEPSVERAGTLLRLRGRLDRASVAGLWPRALAALDGAQALDLQAVEALDSAGLALLAELADRLPQATRRIEGEPPGLAGLCAAYRMNADLIRAQGTV
ncbi:STAS domain-containing protein [Thermomonas fusca]|uniref:STAS domain-containing protein n=1 Tax=Thermomonas fusca TaxID=215690 RepID=A0A5R9PHT8_9GAMM|nr:STAS domain-containing protein [Thermomonas fusca]TLX22627.1 STAS domain-containing protein [Thermomonas fusca]